MAIADVVRDARVHAAHAQPGAEMWNCASWLSRVITEPVSSALLMPLGKPSSNQLAFAFMRELGGVPEGRDAIRALLNDTHLIDALTDAVHAAAVSLTADVSARGIWINGTCIAVDFNEEPVHTASQPLVNSQSTVSQQPAVSQQSVNSHSAVCDYQNEAGRGTVAQVLRRDLHAELWRPRHILRWPRGPGPWPLMPLGSVGP